MLRTLRASAVYLLMFSGLLFGSAGTWRWPAAWILVGLLVVLTLVASAVVDPEVLRERTQLTLPSGTKWWDPLVAGSGFVLLAPVALVVAGWDVQRYHWSPPLPMAVRELGLLVHVVGNAIGLWAMQVNRFFVNFVRIQKERGHRVVDTGPYAYVRHPGYAAGIPAFVAAPLFLGSRWALLPAVLGALFFVVRTKLEDDTLQAELPGYRDYAARVRWRLLPGLW